MSNEQNERCFREWAQEKVFDDIYCTTQVFAVWTDIDLEFDIYQDEQKRITTYKYTANIAFPRPGVSLDGNGNGNGDARIEAFAAFRGLQATPENCRATIAALRLASARP